MQKLSLKNKKQIYLKLMTNIGKHIHCIVWNRHHKTFSFLETSQSII